MTVPQTPVLLLDQMSLVIVTVMRDITLVLMEPVMPLERDTTPQLITIVDTTVPLDTMDPQQQILPILVMDPVVQTVTVSLDQPLRVMLLVRQILLLLRDLMPSTIVMGTEDGTTVTMEPVINPQSITTPQMTTMHKLRVRPILDLQQVLMP